MSAGGRDDEGEVTRALKTQLLDLPTVLRFSAIALVLVGFLGALETGVSPVGADSTFSVLFYLGVGCAVVSIYLAMYRQRPGENADTDGDT